MGKIPQSQRDLLRLLIVPRNLRLLEESPPETFNQLPLLLPHLGAAEENLRHSLLQAAECRSQSLPRKEIKYHHKLPRHNHQNWPNHLQLRRILSSCHLQVGDLQRVRLN